MNIWSGVNADGGTEPSPLREWFDTVEDFDLDGANHLLQMQNPGGQARGLKDFFGRHPIARCETSPHDASR
jgi:hypothetical protein